MSFVASSSLRAPRWRTAAASAVAATLVAGVGCGAPATDDPPGDQPGPVACSGDVCILSGTITEDLTLTPDIQWLLRGGVFIGDDVNETVLTVEPGTTVFGETSTRGFLSISRNAKIIAEGTREAPIVFTSSKEEGQRARGDWGGLIINGNAPVNGCATSPCESFGEGGTGFYGSDDEDDDSGILSFVRVEFAGNLISPDNELNGIAFQGVGRGTTIDFIQVHMAADDCIEFFGGTAEAKHILCTGVADDNLDFTDGWRGKVQFLVAQQFDDAGDNGIEGDNNAENNGALPRSNPTIANVTLIGAPGSDFADTGILLREGTAATVLNAVVIGWGEGCVDIDHDETFNNAIDDNGALTGDLVIAHSLFNCTPTVVVDADDAFDVEAFLLTTNNDNAVSDAALTAPNGVEVVDYRPAATSPAISGGQLPADPFFDVVTFKGGVGPDTDWTAGWSTRVRN